MYLHITNTCDTETHTQIGYQLRELTLEAIQLAADEEKKAFLKHDFLKL